MSEPVPRRPSGAELDEAAAALGPLVARDVSLGAFTTYRVGGPAALLARIGTEADLASVATVVRDRSLPVLVVGKGSNLLVADRGFAGLALVLEGAFATVEIEGNQVRAGAAALLPVVARQTVAAGLSGFEWAVGVPGSIGGAVRMNAGGHGSDMARTLVGVRVRDLWGDEDTEMPAAALDLGYRRSNVRAQDLVLRADLALAPGDPVAGEAELTEIVRWRRANQPGGPNAGSVFTNPAGDSAGRLIDEAGLKGLRVGTASVSTKHANFIQADRDGSADDVRALMIEIERRVADATGVHLHAETCLVGFDPEDRAERA